MFLHIRNEKSKSNYQRDEKESDKKNVKLNVDSKKAKLWVIKVKKNHFD